MPQILLVEDDIALRGGIALALRGGIALALRGEDTVVLQTGSLCDARAQLAASRPDLVVLDLNLPDGNGLTLLPELRAAQLPVIILSANDLETDIVTGLELGADDYITKPFSLMVLRARVGAQLRKLQAPKVCYEQDGLCFDFERMEFRKDGQPVELSKTEQKLLRLLTDHAGSTLTRAQLVDRVWSDGADYVDENALSVAIKRLRDKLEETPSAPRYIKTVYGVGYSWVAR